MQNFQKGKYKNSGSDGDDNNLHNSQVKREYGKLFNRGNQKIIFLVLVTQSSGSQQYLYMSITFECFFFPGPNTVLGSARLSRTRDLNTNTSKYLLRNFASP